MSPAETTELFARIPECNHAHYRALLEKYGLISKPPTEEQIDRFDPETIGWTRKRILTERIAEQSGYSTLIWRGITLSEDACIRVYRTEVPIRPVNSSNQLRIEYKVDLIATAEYFKKIKVITVSLQGLTLDSALGKALRAMEGRGLGP